jgi:hypothetical protein
MEATDKQEHATEEHQDRRPETQPSGRNIGSPPSHGDQHTPTNDDDELKKFEKITIVLGIVGTLLALGTAVVFYEQFKEMSAQTDTLNTSASQARRDSAEASLRVAEQLRIAQEQAAAARDSVKAIQRQMRQDQRPWIRIDLGDPDPDGKTHWRSRVGDPFKGPIRFTNTGKTPAKHIVANVYIDIIPVGQQLRLPIFLPPWGKQVSLRGAKRTALAGTTIQAGRIFPGNHATQEIDRVQLINGELRPQILSVAEANDLGRVAQVSELFSLGAIPNGGAPVSRLSRRAG